jgi:hypothetical protein
MPQTAGWYVVFALLLLLILWSIWRVLLHWRGNRYRREALRELPNTSASAIPVLLKRTALAAWPREQVASLSGERWLRFLQTTGGASSFVDGFGQTLVDLECRAVSLSPDDERALRQAAGEWIRRHRVRA